jgi:O-antigen/teichoic acid export membrane protein
LLLVARMLGPRQFGAFAGVASLAVMLGTVSTFGMNIVLLGEVAKAPSLRWHVLRYAIPTTLLCGSALLVIYLLVCSLVLRIPGISWLVLLTIGTTELWLQPLFSLTVYEHHGLGRIARSQLLRVLPLALRLIAAAGVFLMHPDDPLTAYAYAYPVISLAALALAVRTFPSRWPTLTLWRLPRRSALRGAAGYAALAITASGPGELDKTLATKLLPLATAGVYAVGARIIVAATLPISAMLTSALPRLFREGGHQSNRTGRLLLWIFGATAAYVFAITLVLWLIAPVFEWLFSAKYQGLDHTVRWLCLAAPGLALRMVAGTVLMALGRPWVRVGFEITGLVVLVGTSVVLTTRFGALGMPAALACSEWAMAVIGIALVLGHMVPGRARS